MRILVSLCFLLLCLQVKSQTLFGPKLGVSFSGITNNGQYAVVKPGFSGGLFFKKAFNKRLSLESEVLFTQKGYKKKFGDKLFDQLTTNYLQLPIMIDYKFNNWPLSLQVGPYYGRWLSGEYASRINKESQIITEDYEFTESYDEAGFKDNRNEMGLAVGLNFWLTEDKWFIDIKYYQGFSDIKQWQSAPDNMQKRLNQQLIIALAYSLIHRQ